MIKFSTLNLPYISFLSISEHSLLTSTDLNVSSSIFQFSFLYKTKLDSLQCYDQSLKYFGLAASYIWKDQNVISFYCSLTLSTVKSSLKLLNYNFYLTNLNLISNSRLFANEVKPLK
jgi:hypothetical protein